MRNANAKPSVISVVNALGVPFNVVVIRKGEHYGLDDRLTHESYDPLIEFYDARYTEGFTPMGQFVSRYYLSTLLDDRRQCGLDLCGHRDPAWTLDEESYRKVIKALEIFCSA